MSKTCEKPVLPSGPACCPACGETFGMAEHMQTHIAEAHLGLKEEHALVLTEHGRPGPDGSLAAWKASGLGNRVLASWRRRCDRQEGQGRGGRGDHREDAGQGSLAGDRARAGVGGSHAPR
eukprot:9381776-Lingulodinium_polyedra.AAC.1